MYRLIFSFVLFFNFLFASSLESLLEEYEDTSNNSLQTLNEKMGHARIYSQKDLRLMQYDRLSDILKELPINNLNKSTFGTSTLSLAGTKSQTTGYFRLFINDHEVSSPHTQSPFLNWFEIPIELIDYVEIYYGEGSFTLGNETGVEFIRVYTKKASKQNGTNIKSTITNKSTNSQEISHSELFENGWSYLLYYANQNTFFNRTYNNKKLNSNSSQQYLFLDVSDSKNSINIAYTTLNKDNYKGLSFDANSDSGEIVADHFYIDYNRYFLNDKSLKLNLSVDIQNRDYEESNNEGIAAGNILNSYLTRNIKNYSEDLKFTKINAQLSKNFKTKRNNLFTAINIKNKKYKTNSRTINTTQVGPFNNFDEETIYSILLQNDYKVLDNLIFIGNLKIDKYQRSGYMEDNTKVLYRIGSIYLPNKNLGFKTFYTISHIPPSFYNTDFVFSSKPKLKTQEYRYFTSEGAYTFGDSRLSLEYFNVNIDDYIYLASPIGFINVDHTIKTDGFIFDYLYNLDRNSKIEVNYYASQLSEVKSSYTQGGYFKYMQDYDRFSYFTSLIYRHGFKYQGLDIKNSFNLALGATYNFTKNFSLSLKGENLLNKSTQSIYSDSPTVGSSTLFLLNDYDRNISFSLKWRF